MFTTFSYKQSPTTAFNPIYTLKLPLTKGFDVQNWPRQPAIQYISSTSFMYCKVIPTQQIRLFRFTLSFNLFTILDGRQFERNVTEKVGYKVGNVCPFQIFERGVTYEGEKPPSSCCSSLIYWESEALIVIYRGYENSAKYKSGGIFLVYLWLYPKARLVNLLSILPKCLTKDELSLTYDQAISWYNSVIKTVRKIGMGNSGFFESYYTQTIAGLAEELVKLRELRSMESILSIFDHRPVRVVEILIVAYIRDKKKVKVQYQWRFKWLWLVIRRVALLRIRTLHFIWSSIHSSCRDSHHRIYPG